jgi:hypothetical protein
MVDEQAGRRGARDAGGRGARGVRQVLCTSWQPGGAGVQGGLGRARRPPREGGLAGVEAGFGALRRGVGVLECPIRR